MWLQEYLMQDDMGSVVMALHRIPTHAIPAAPDLIRRAMQFKVTNRQLRFLKAQYVAVTHCVHADAGHHK